MGLNRGNATDYLDLSARRTKCVVIEKTWDIAEYAL
jgi:hypothetical protein